MDTATRSPDELRLHTFEITDEPVALEESGMPELERRLGEESFDTLQSLVYENPPKAFERLERLVAEHPDIPLLGNWLIATAIQTGVAADIVLRLARESFNRAPGYLFHRCELVNRLIYAGHIDEARSIFQQYALLSDFYPHRAVFHLSEVRAFFAARANYFNAIGEPEGAVACFDMLEQLFPEDDALLDSLGMRILPSLIVARMSGRSPRRGRAKRSKQKKVAKKAAARKKNSSP